MASGGGGYAATVRHDPGERGAAPPPGEFPGRWDRLRASLARAGADGLFATGLADMYYLAGRILNGYFYLPLDGPPALFLRVPAAGAGEAAGAPAISSAPIHRPRDIPAAMAALGLAAPRAPAFEDAFLPYAEAAQLMAAFPGAAFVAASRLLRGARSVKTPYEVGLARVSCAKAAGVFARIPSLYRPGMRDDDLVGLLAVECHNAGHLGILRSFGQYLEAPESSLVLAGRNAAAPGPYDWSLCGQGPHPAMPFGATGAALREGETLQVDMGLNANGYNADMTRTFSIGRAPAEALRAHAAAREIHGMMRREAVPGAVCAELYEKGAAIARARGLEGCFMGIERRARFFGHGIGIELNELPVIAASFTTPLEEGMLLAVEPKFVLPGIGAAGYENTYLVTRGGLECLTPCEEGIIELA